MADEKKVTEIPAKPTPPAKGSGICPYCLKPIIKTGIKFDPLPNGKFLLVFACSECFKVLSMQIAPPELMAMHPIVDPNSADALGSASAREAIDRLKKKN